MKLGGKYVIPGATLRGAMRAAMGIVCRARLTQVNINHRYGVRDFDHPLFNQGRDTPADRLAWHNLGSGWLQKKPATDLEKEQGFSDYVLTPCDKKIIRIRALPKRLYGEMETNSSIWHLTWLTTELARRYASAGYRIGATRDKPVFGFGDAQKTSFVAAPNEGSDQYVVEKAGLGSTGGWFVFSNRLGTIKPLNRLNQKEKDEYLHKLEYQDRANPGEQGFFKKREYVFFDRPGAGEFRLTRETFERFHRINSKPGKTALKPDGSYAVMAPTLDALRRIPVFYAGDPEHQELGMDLGLTRLFKLSHKNSVGQVLHRQAEHVLVRKAAIDDQGIAFATNRQNSLKLVRKEQDLVESVFGYVYDRHDLCDLGDSGDANGWIEAPSALAPEEIARKGRIAFGFAKLAEGIQCAETENITTTAMAPRASYAPFYLRGPIKDWTDESTTRRKPEARLAGRKRYFARFPKERLVVAEREIIDTLDPENAQPSRSMAPVLARHGGHNRVMQDTDSTLRLLKPPKGGELLFTGTIRLHNVTAEEVGALLWTLTHGGASSKPYRHMIGRAKNAGAGQTRVKSLKLMLTAHPGKSSKEALLTSPEPWEIKGLDGGWSSPGGQSLGPFLRAFEKFMKEQDQRWPQVDDIRELLGVSDPVKGAELSAAYLPTPNKFGDLRKAVKADVRNDPAPVTPATDRLLRVPKVANVETPYVIG